MHHTLWHGQDLFIANLSMFRCHMASVRVRVLFHHRCAMLRCIWLLTIIFLGTCVPRNIIVKSYVALALVETDSVKLCFLYAKMRAMDGFATMETSHTRATHLPRTATLRQRIFVIQLHLWWGRHA